MDKCNSYCVEEKFRRNDWNDVIIVKVGKCNGTRERDECSCGGDPTKCDFYPEKRELASHDVDTKDLIEALRLCVKYNKPYDALANCERAAERLEQLDNENSKLFEQLHDSYTEHLLCIVIPKLEEEIKSLKDTVKKLKR